jgi:hypothetical protein
MQTTAPAGRHDDQVGPGRFSQSGDLGGGLPDADLPRHADVTAAQIASDAAIQAARSWVILSSSMIN